MYLGTASSATRTCILSEHRNQRSGNVPSFRRFPENCLECSKWNQRSPVSFSSLNFHFYHNQFVWETEFIDHSQKNSLKLQNFVHGRRRHWPVCCCPVEPDPEDGQSCVHCDRSSKAAKEAAKYGKVVELKPDLASLPTADLQFEKDNSYVYYCANETVHGVEFQFVPETNGVPLVADMSSNILTKDIDISKV